MLVQPEPESRWPVVKDLNCLPAMGGQISEAISELERCWRSGTVVSALASPELQLLLGPLLLRAYQEVSFEPREDLCKQRELWVNYALEDFKKAFAPAPTVFHSIQDVLTQCHFVKHERVAVSVRRDQALSVRFWGIGVEPSVPEQAAALANSILRRSLARFSSDMICIGKMCRAYLLGRIELEGIRWSSHGKGVLFERLIADVLNEDELRAKRAPLFEDLFEWTDLRVAYPGLGRKHGARVQVKFIGDLVVHDNETARWKFPDSYVVVSPVKLAEFAEFCVEADEAAEVPPEFWASLGDDPADRAELASTLLRVFHLAIHTGSPHPLGPMVNLPMPIRQFVRAFTRHEAFAAAKTLRETIPDHTNQRPPWRSQFSNR